MTSTHLYDPAIEKLVSSRERAWGDPEENRQGMIPYGIKHFDSALYGIDLRNGELIVVQAQEKQRKTTFLCNVVKFICQAGRMPPQTRICIDTLESGMTPGRYADVLISMVATELLLAERWGKDPTRWPPIKEMATDDTPGLVGKKHEGITPEFLAYHHRTPNQVHAITQAMGEVSSWPLDIYGAGSAEGNTRMLQASRQRWDADHQNRHLAILGIDHFQEYWVGSDVGDYQKMEIALPIIADFVTQNRVVGIVLSQVSLGSVRDARMGIGKTRAKGGGRLAAEANVVIQTTYDSAADPYKVVLAVVDSRRSGAPKVIQGIEPASGLFVGPSKPYGEFG